LEPASAQESVLELVQVQVQAAWVLELVSVLAPAQASVLEQVQLRVRAPESGPALATWLAWVPDVEVLVLEQERVSAPAAEPPK
jgi:hypothetical protein